MQRNQTRPPPVNATWRFQVARRVGHLKWVRFGVRDRLLRAVCSPDAEEGELFRSTIGSALYEGRFNSYIDWSVWCYGAYEQALSSWMCRAVDHMGGGTVWDVGANTGTHSLALARHGVVEAFEPSPAIVEALMRNLELNPSLPIHVHAFGVGAKDESRAFFPSATSNQGTGSFAGPQGAQSSGPLWLSTRNADQMVRKAEIALPVLVKVDVEGLELEVLAGMRNTLHEARPILVVEVGGDVNRHVRPDDVIKLLPHSYTVVGTTSIAERLVTARFDAPRVSGLLLVPNEWAAVLDRRMTGAAAR